MAIPNAVLVTDLLPVELPPALTVTLSPPTKDCKVFRTPSSHCASQPSGSGSGGGKKVNPVKVSVPESEINAILQILILSFIAPAAVVRLNIESSVILSGLPLAVPPFSKFKAILDSGNATIICSIMFAIWFMQAHPTPEPGSPGGPLGPVAPVAPLGPVAPVAPLGPVAPVAPLGPVAPVAPLGPVAPVAPLGPVAPVAPLGPVAPVAPLGPVAPVAPLGPVAPVAPVKPLGPIGPIGPRGPLGPGGPGHGQGQGQQLQPHLSKLTSHP